MIKFRSLWLAILVLIVSIAIAFGLGQPSAVAQRPTPAPRAYVCKASSLGITATKLDVEFRFPETTEPIQNLYLQVTDSRTKQAQLWDAVFSSDGDYSYWATPLLRNVGVGISPLVVVLTPSRATTPQLELQFDRPQPYVVACKR